MHMVALALPDCACSCHGCARVRAWCGAQRMGVWCARVLRSVEPAMLRPVDVPLRGFLRQRVCATLPSGVVQQLRPVSAKGRRARLFGLENGSQEHGPSCTHHLPSSLPTPPATQPSIYRPADVAQRSPHTACEQTTASRGPQPHCRTVGWFGQVGSAHSTPTHNA